MPAFADTEILPPIFSETLLISDPASSFKIIVHFGFQQIRRRRKNIIRSRTKVVYLWDKRPDMKKKAKPVKYKNKEDDNILNEPMQVYHSIKTIPAVLNFPFRKFEKIAGQIAFTQKEWSSILHLSEKTLQRYSKDNKSFEGIYVDRILQMQELIKMGLETFTSTEALYRWLKRDKPVLGELLTFDSLKNSRGIQLIIDQLGRIQHGVYI